MIDGKEVTSELRFTPEKSSGTVEMEFILDTTGLGGHDLVVFEYLEFAENGKPAAEHTDVEDEDQTVTVTSPEIGTTAYVGEGEEKSGVVSEDVIIRDIVHYKGLVPGKAVTITGTLMAKASNEPFLVDGIEVISSVTFTPEATEGDVEITFEFNGVEIIRQKTELVAFESLSYENSDVELAVHAEIEDEAQTVMLYPAKGSVQVIKTNAEDPNDLLSDAVFAVYADTDSDGEYNEENDSFVGKLEETEQGIYALADLPLGDYFLYEQEAPEGFIRDEKYHPFSIAEAGKIVNVETIEGSGFANESAPAEPTPTPEFTDKPEPTSKPVGGAPQTGDNTNLGFWIGLCGTSLGGLVAALILYLKRKRESE